MTNTILMELHVCIIGRNTLHQTDCVQGSRESAITDTITLEYYFSMKFSLKVVIM